MFDVFNPMRERAEATYAEWERPVRPRIDIAIDTSSLAAGADLVGQALARRAAERGAAVDFGQVVGYGMQWLQPLVDITWPDGTRVLYGPVTMEHIDLIIDEATGREGAASSLAIATLAGERAGLEPVERHPFLALETERRLLSRIGRADPDSLEHYIATGGYYPVARMIERHQTPEAVRQLVIDAGLTGRGGAAFPAGVKWNFLAGAPSEERYLVCNADEGDPGGFVNRVLLEGDPHSILEGMVIAAFATGARHGFIYIRNEYPLAVERMRRAVEQATEAGLLGPSILGTDFGFTAEVIRGAGAYVCGEETGLIASVQDDRGMPRIKPPFPANSGVLFKPTNVNNVETYANVPLILRHGSDWFREMGTAQDVGTKIFSFTGNIPYVGFMEVPFGIPLRRVLEVCGGIEGGGELKAIQAGGPLAGYLPGRLLDELTLERAPFTKHNALIGGGGIVFVGPDACSVDLNVMFARFLEEESCGRCTTCHHGNQRMTEVFRRVSLGAGRVEDRHNLEVVGSTLLYSNCVHGQASPTIMRNTLRFFEDEFDAHINGMCPAKQCTGLSMYRVVKQSDPKLPDAQAICPTGAIKGSRWNYSVDDTLCIRCNACAEVAPEGIEKQAAPPGIAYPERRPPSPPTPLGYGRPPLSYQQTATARPVRGMGGAPPLPASIRVAY